ncbi:MAG: NAD-dependent succinate-semialdehyde dehydrogenase [Myxococcales bacterium]|nr:NAD-dependent succinate-semialdehyde dehydrogenase [Myxococcales bacterium]
MYPDTLLHIDGAWRPGRQGRTIPVQNPATGAIIGQVAHAETEDLDDALAAAERGFQLWRRTSAYDRYQLMRRAADLFRGRADDIARRLTLEQGKPLAEALGEVKLGVDLIEWFAEEGRRTYGRVIPARAPNVEQLVIREPVGPVAAFTPWNFPINQVVRKLCGAVATGCSIIIKAPEETPASPADLVAAFVDAGVPPGVVQLVFGVPSEVSSYLIPHPIIRKVTFTGSTQVGKQLAALAGLHMKRATMELGGHAPAVVFADADVEYAAKLLATVKFRNAGQVCTSPTRFLVERSVYDRFVEGFVAAAERIVVGDGLLPTTRMGPLANERRLRAMEELVADARACGSRVLTGGHRIGTEGFFFAPTVLVDLPARARILSEEPFGPLVPIQPFDSFAEVLAEANRLPYGLAAYAYTKSLTTAQAYSAGVESGMVAINHHGLALPELPFGGIKDSGHGNEGGTEGLEGYLNTKLVTRAGL